MNKTIFYIQDGSILDSDIYDKFKDSIEPGDIIKNNNIYISKFVGFIFTQNELLVSFPKNYFNPSELKEKLLSNHSKSNNLNILFKVIQKATIKSSNHSLGLDVELNSNYPFKEFLDIYNYYLNFGLIKNETQETNKSYGGKIDWQSTLFKSQIVINDNNLLYLPLITKKKKQEEFFLTKCMAYAINTSVKLFSQIFNFKSIELDLNNIHWNNTDLIVSQLKKFNDSTFKDNEKKLIKSLILFFKKINNGKDAFKIKTKNFDLIWEEIIHEYLNKYFNGISNEGYINFTNTRNLYSKNFHKGNFNPELVGKLGRTLKPDHYMELGANKYIFDSKYYSSINELNYKQVAYYFLLKDFQESNDNNCKILNTYNILLLPTYKDPSDSSNKIKHFELNPEFNNSETNFSIKEQYINMKYAMTKYIYK